MPTHTPVPLVGLPCCVRQPKAHRFHMVGEKYILAALDVAETLPILIPSLGERLDIDGLIERLDGLVLTGSPSNVEPTHYDGPPPPDGNLADPDRDSTTLPLIRKAIAAGVPVLGICRGHQELNVALGGSLFQEVHKQPERLDHRSNDDDPVDVQYGPAHPAHLAPGGIFEALAGGAREITINSLHGQGIDRLAPGLKVEATAPDGQIEAVRLEGVDFVVGVQWHPEWKARENPFSVALFQAFGAACRRRAAARAGLTRAA